MLSTVNFHKITDMVSAYYQIVFFFVCLVLQSWSARSDNFLSPILSPVLDDLCKDIECGKGNCKVSSNSTFGYECECESGWKQAHIEKDDSANFMPCVIPNCTINLSCSDAPPPAQQDANNQSHTSIIDPCHWADCGGGTCNRTSVFGHRCDCSEGYYNLLNVTAFPCFKQCALGGDCARLGITVMNKTVPSPSSSSSTDNSQSRATSILGGRDHIHNHGWFILIALFISLVTWK